jgi:hypothetical protein
MDKKINIAELLQDCPSGMELDCTIYENVYFDYVDEYNIIHCYIQHELYKTSTTFNQYGTLNSNIKSKCVIFPKGKTAWEGFIPLCKFKDGDICYVKTRTLFEYIFIFKVSEDYNYIKRYVNLSAEHLLTDKIALCTTDDIMEIRLATEEERAQLFQVIKDSGYRWNAEIKTLDKLPKFKVGDRIKQKGSPRIYVINSIESDRYRLNNNQFIRFVDEKIYELVPNKFDITTLKPFDKVLVRTFCEEKWKADFFSHYSEGSDFPYNTIVKSYYYCIPYKGNEYLRGTNDDCNNFYKTWE